MPRRPRLLVLTTTFPARAGDGTPEFVLTLARALTPEADVTLLAPRVPGSVPAERMGGVAVRRFAYFPRRWEGLADGAIMPNLRAQPWRILEAPLLVAAMLWHAWQVARRLRPDVVHAHWLLPSGLIAVALRAVLGIPFVVTVHGADAHALRARPLRWLKGLVVGRAEAVCPVSREIAVLLGLRPEQAIPMGVDVSAIARRVGRRAPRFGELLFVGRLAEKKGIDVLFRALAEVPGAGLTVVGDGPEEGRLRRLADELGLDGRVRFTGRLGGDQVLERLQSAYALVVPSRVASDGDRDGTPVVLGEAMAAGVPVIASRIAGLGEQIEDGVDGLLVSPGAPDELSAALRWALAHPEPLAEMGARARDRLRGGDLDLATTADRYRRLLAELAAHAPDMRTAA